MGCQVLPLKLSAHACVQGEEARVLLRAYARYVLPQGAGPGPSRLGYNIGEPSISMPCSLPPLSLSLSPLAI